MKHIVVSVIMLAFLSFPSRGLAQHGSHGGRGTGAAPASGGAPPDNTDLTDFKHAVQVQANPYQVTEFHTASKNTAQALKGAHDFAQLAAGAKSFADVSSPAVSLNDALDEAQKSNTAFLNMLTDSQVAGLKKLLKELNKSGSAVNKQHKNFSESIDRSEADPKRLASEADSLEKVLTNFQESQRNLAKEMGIQNP